MRSHVSVLMIDQESVSTEMIGTTEIGTGIKRRREIVVAIGVIVIGTVVVTTNVTVAVSVIVVTVTAIVKRTRIETGIMKVLMLTMNVGAPGIRIMNMIALKSMSVNAMVKE